MLTYIVSLVAVILVGYLLLKKLDIKMSLFIVGIIMIYIALFMGLGIQIKNYKSVGLLLDPINAIVITFKNVLSSSGLIIMILGGYTSYMSKIGANDLTVNALTKPMKAIKSPYILVPVVFLLGNLLSLVIPSASNLAIILLATLYPVLVRSGMSNLTAAGVIATTATIMPTPLGGDNVAVATELAKSPLFPGMNASTYSFAYHAKVSIPTLLAMAIIHYFWQKYLDKKNTNFSIENTNKSESTHIESNIDGGIYKSLYSILPILPIILLLITYIAQRTFSFKSNLSVEVATLLSFFIAIIIECIRSRNFKNVLERTEAFFKGMGNSIGIVALLVAASVFVLGLQSIGLISNLQKLMTSVQGNGMGFVLPLILVLLSVLIVMLSGSGTALFYAMVPLMVPLALAAGISPIAVSIPMGLAGNLMRAVSPVSAVVMIVAGTTKENPMRIVKRTSVPMIFGVIMMFILSMLLFL